MLFGADVTEPVREANGLHWKMFCARAAQSVDGNGWRIEDFLQHALKEILIYDQQNDTPYYESMYQYLLCGKNMKLAAQALEIHRNTLDYRISRIGKLFHIDFEDRHVCYEMLFSCKLYEETGKLYG